MPESILIVEDDRQLNNGIKLTLSNQGYEFHQCLTLQEARRVLAETRVSLILLDVNLPDGNGIDFVREVRLLSAVPIILLTVNNMELDIVTGLDAGANDYITKPFSLMVLRARVEVQLRESKKVSGSEVICDRFIFDFDRMVFSKDGVPIILSKTEQKILSILFENRGITITRERLIDYIWNDEAEFVEEHALTVSVKRLRDKLEDNPGAPEYIKTVYGLGYRWEA